MLTINPKYKIKIIPKKDTEIDNKEEETNYNKNIINGKGLNELIEKVKDIKLKEISKKINSNKKISF